jgi:hypothetical protein
MTEQQPDSSPREPAGMPLDYSRPERRRWLPPGFLAGVARRAKVVGKWTGRGALVIVILFLLAVGFGTSGTDATRMRQFSDAVERWQHNPDFRQIQQEYVEMGSEAMRTDVCFVDSTRVVLALRSMPGLSRDWAINDTSVAHYTHFRQGPLSAYMHLTREQGLSDTLKMLQYLGSKSDPSDEDVRDFLKQYKLYYPVASDAGAVASVRSLINDVDPGRALAVRDGVAERLLPHIAAVAKSLGYPEDVKAMTPDAQLEVWHMLDREVRETDYELWRTKQVNDWLNGVWAQVYGAMYTCAINPTLTLREFGRAGGPLLVMAWVGMGLWRKRREMDEVGGQGAVGPRLALEGGDEMGKA